MPDTFYNRRLQRDISRWVEGGILSENQGDAIRADVAGRTGLWARLGVVHLLGTIGALFVGIGVILFIAANWEAIPKLARVAMVLALLWSCHGAAWWALAKEDRAWLGEAALLLSALAFGAAIALIAQIFHLSSNNAGGVLLWSLGIFATALIARGQLVAVLGIALTCLWTLLVVSGELDEIWYVLELDQGHDPNAPFAIFWLAWAALAVWHQWRFASHMLVLIMTFWIWLAASPLILWLLALTETPIPAGFSARDYQIWSAMLPVVAAIFLIFIAAGRAVLRSEKLEMMGRLLARYSLAWLALTLYGLTKFVQERALFSVSPAAMAVLTGLIVVAVIIAVSNRPDRRFEVPQVLLAVVALCLIFASAMPGSLQVATAATLMILNVAGWIALLLWGHRVGHRFLVNLSFLVLGGWLLDIYFTHFWSLLDRALFFIGGGLLMVLLAVIFVRQQRRLSNSAVAG